MRRHRIVGDGTTILAEPQVGLARFEEHLDASALPVELDDFFLRKREVCRDEDEIILPLVAVPHEDQSHRHEGFSLFRRDSIDGQEVTRASAAFLVFLVDGLDVRDLPFAEVAHLLALKKINPTFYMGSGKIEELQDLIEKTNAEIIVFNNELSASQIKNIEEEVKGDYE